MSIVDKERYPELETGCTTFLPHGARCAWGARATWDGNTPRFYWKYMFGDGLDKEAMGEWLGQLGQKAVALMQDERGAIYRAPVVLYRDGEGVIFAYGNQSRAYVYLAAVLRAHLPQDFDWERTKYANWGGGK